MKGTQTRDNRDFCGVFLGKTKRYFVLADGITNCPNGGLLAKELIQSILYAFKYCCTAHKQQSMVKCLQTIHEKLRIKYYTDSASYLIGVLSPQNLLITLHAGDCLAGKVENKNKIEWIISPHTLANPTQDHVAPETIAKDINRNRLTRSFRGKRFKEPEFNSFHLAPDDEILFASDGFWAELSEQKQIKLLRGGYPPKYLCDDTSVLLIGNYINGIKTLTNNSQNLIRLTPQTS